MSNDDLMHDLIVIMWSEFFLGYTFLVGLPRMLTARPGWPRWKSVCKEWRYDLELFFWLKIQPRMKKLIARCN